MNIRVDTPSGVPEGQNSSVGGLCGPVKVVLHYGGAKHPLAEVVPDANWPGMWRVRYDGNLSDMANLSRARDAAVAIAERGPPERNGRRLHWLTRAVD